jgi:hypothetical protein
MVIHYQSSHRDVSSHLLSKQADARKMFVAGVRVTHSAYFYVFAAAIERQRNSRGHALKTVMITKQNGRALVACDEIFGL